jgi:hypothetical protein
MWRPQTPYCQSPPKVHRTLSPIHALALRSRPPAARCIHHRLHQRVLLRAASHPELRWAFFRLTTVLIQPFSRSDPPQLACARRTPLAIPIGRGPLHTNTTVVAVIAGELVLNH